MARWAGLTRVDEWMSGIDSSVVGAITIGADSATAM